MGKSLILDYKILFAKKSKVNNTFLSGFYAFLFFSLVFNVVIYLALFNKIKITNEFLFSEMYSMVGIVYLCRIMESSENTDFSYTLPISKRIYTKDLCILFSLFSLVFMLIKIVGTVICIKNGSNYEYFRGILFGDCFIQFLFLVFEPIFLKITKKEYATSMCVKSGSKISYSIIIIFLFVFLPIILLINHFLKYVDFVVKDLSLPIFALIYCGIFVAGIIINCVLLHRNYNKR